MISSDKKVAKDYICESCNYKCFNKTNYEKHLATAKHKKLQNMIKSDKIMINSDEKVAKVVNEKFVYIIKKNLKKNTPKIRYFCFVTLLHNKNIFTQKVIFFGILYLQKIF